MKGVQSTFHRGGEEQNVQKIFQTFSKSCDQGCSLYDSDLGFKVLTSSLY